MSYLAPLKTTSSVSLIHGRKRVLGLYRQWIRAVYLFNKAPEICDIYHLEVNSRTLRRRIRQEFEKNKFVKDLSMVDILLFKGRTELEETMNAWKQPTHVMRYFEHDEYQEPKTNDFLTNFYQGSI